MKKILFLVVTILVAQFILAQTVTIGTGTSTAIYPLNYYWGYSRSAAIYNSSDLGNTTTKTVLSIAY